MMREAVLLVVLLPLLHAPASLARDSSTSPFASDPALVPYASLARTAEGASLLALARRSMEAHFRGVPGEWSALPDWPGAPVAVYVSLVRDRATRACVGSPVPVRGSLAGTVEALAVLALVADRRRPPVREEELPGLRIVLSFAADGEPVADPMEVDPGREGLLVTTARGSIAFLPGEARTVGWALREARRAGILLGPVRSASYLRFPVVAFGDPEFHRAPENDSGKEIPDDAP